MNEINLILGVGGFLVAQLLINVAWLVKLTIHVNKEIAGSNERLARMEADMEHVMKFVETRTRRNEEVATFMPQQRGG